MNGGEVTHTGNYRRKGSIEFMKGLPLGVSPDDPDIIEDHFQNKLAAANFCLMTEDYEKAAKYAREVCIYKLISFIKFLRRLKTNQD